MAGGGDMHEPDPSVVAAATRGDIEAFAEIVRALQPDVWRFCMSMVRDPSLADDLTQDAFLKAFRFMHRYRGTARFTTWLFSIARNCVLDEVRRADRRRRIDDRLTAQPEPMRADAGVAVEMREAMYSLPPLLREAVFFVDVLGMAYRDASALAGVPVGTMKSRVHKARSSLVEAFADERGRDADDA